MEAAVNQGARVVRIFDDSSALDRAAAGLVTESCRDAIAARGRFTLALSGGRTPQGLYRLLAGPPYRDRIDWTAVHVFWADERGAPPDHRDSNYRLVNDLLLSHVPVPPKNVHRIHGENAPDRAASDYEKELRDILGTPVPAFDLVLLGMGADGHTASLFPGHLSVDESSRIAAPVPDAPDGRQRVTLTLPVLEHALLILFLVTGRAKSDAVAKVLEQGNPGQYPAGLVRSRSGTVQWFLDRAAANGLNEFK